MAAFNGDGTLANVQGAKAASPIKLNWIQRNLNSIGGGAGATGGALGGAALGTAVLPGVGTVAGGILGALAGGAAGGAAGEAGKQNLEGNSGAGASNEIRKQALIQGGLGAAGEGAGSLLAHFLPAASEGAGALTEGLQNFAGKKVAQSIGSELPKGAIQTGGDATRLLENSKFLSSLGLNGAPDRAAAADIATSGANGNGFLSGIKNSILGNAQGEVPVLETLGKNSVADAIAKNGVSGADKNAIQTAVAAHLGTTNPEGAVGSMAVSPAKAFSVQQALDGLAATARSEGKTSMAKTYKGLSSAVASAIDSHAGTNAAVAAYQVPAEQVASLTDRAVAALGHQKGTALADHLVGGANNARSIPDLRDLEATFVPASKAATSAAVGDLTGGGSNLAAQGAAAAVSPFGKGAFVRSLITKMNGPEAAAASGLSKVTGAAGSILGKLTDAGLAAAPAIPAAAKALSDRPQAAPTVPTETPTPTTDTTDASTDPSSAFDANTLQALAIHDIQTTGGKNLTKIAQLDSLFGPKAQPKPSAADQKTAANIQGAQSSLDTADQQLQDMGGAQGPLAGAVGKIPLIGQYLNPKEAAYDKTRVATGTALAQAITGSTRVPSAAAIKQWTDQLPSPTDNPQVAAQKLANLRQQLSSKAKSSPAVAALLTQ